LTEDAGAEFRGDPLSGRTGRWPAAWKDNSENAVYCRSMVFELAGYYPRM
jgi:hypothetical protein